MNNAEQKIRTMIGNLVVENIALTERVEELEKKLKELEQPKDKTAD